MRLPQKRPDSEILGSAKETEKTKKTTDKRSADDLRH